MTNVELFAERLKEQRIKKGLSLAELAEALGVTAQSLSFYERAQRTINIDLLEKISRYFDVSADYLLGLSDIPSLNTNIQAVCTYTGLSEKAVGIIRETSTREKVLKCMRSEDDEAFAINEVKEQNRFIENHYLQKVLSQLEMLTLKSHFAFENKEYVFMYHAHNFTDKLQVEEEVFCKRVLNKNFYKIFKADNRKAMESIKNSVQVSRYQMLKLSEELCNEYDMTEEFKEYDCEQWCKYFGISAQELKEMQEESEKIIREQE